MPTFNGEYNYYYRLRLDLTPQAHTASDIANNHTRVNYTLYLQNDNAYFSEFRNKNTYLKINGKTVWSYDGKTSLSGTYQLTKLCSGTETIGHRADGTMLLPFEARFDLSSYASYTQKAPLTVSGKMELETIPRTSDPTFSTYNAEFGSTITINTNRASNTFTHTVSAKFGNKTIEIGKDVGDKTTWTVPNSLMNEIPDKTSLAGLIACSTYSGTTLIGTRHKNLTLTVPASVKPAISSISVTDANTSSYSQMQAFVQGKSRLKITINASGKYGASIRRYSTATNGQALTGKTVTTNTIVDNGSLKINCTVTDSRGRSTTVTKTVNIESYTPPSINEFKVFRSNSDGTESQSGAFAKIEYDAKITSLNKKNTAHYEIKYKKTAESNWTTVAVSADADQSAKGHKVLSGIDPEKSYTFKFLASDFYTSTSPVEQAVSIGTAATLFDFLWGGLGLTIGKVAELKNTFEVAFSAIFRNNIQIYENANQEARLHIFDQARRLWASIGKHPDLDGISLYDHQGAGFNFITSKSVNVNGKKVLTENNYDEIILTKENGWNDNDTDIYHIIRARKTHDGMVHLSGMTSPKYATSAQITTLPVGWCPGYRHHIPVATSQGTTYISIYNGGSITIHGDYKNMSWVSFAGVSFYLP